jgi:hypothetical protein
LRLRSKVGRERLSDTTTMSAVLLVDRVGDDVRARLRSELPHSSDFRRDRSARCKQGIPLGYPSRKPVRTTEKIGDFEDSTRKPVGNIGEDASLDFQI